jgi:hypothetical protein
MKRIGRTRDVGGIGRRRRNNPEKGKKSKGRIISSNSSSVGVISQVESLEEYIIIQVSYLVLGTPKV